MIFSKKITGLFFLGIFWGHGAFSMQGHSLSRLHRFSSLAGAGSRSQVLRAAGLLATASALNYPRMLEFARRSAATSSSSWQFLSPVAALAVIKSLYDAGAEKISGAVRELDLLTNDPRLRPLLMVAAGSYFLWRTSHLLRKSGFLDFLVAPQALAYHGNFLGIVRQGISLHAESSQPVPQQYVRARLPESVEAESLGSENYFDASVPAASEQLADVECPVCFEEKNAGERVTLSCGHACCADCLRDMVDLAIRQKRTEETLRCPIQGCLRDIEEQDVRKVVDSDAKLSALLDVKFYEWFRRQPGAKNCPTLDCSWAYLEDQDAGVQSITCPQCENQYCSHCQIEHQADISCEEARMREASEGNSESDGDSERWKLEHAKPCPQCHTDIERSEGCDHMTCRNCGYEFCYRCLGKYHRNFCNRPEVHRAQESSLPEAEF